MKKMIALVLFFGLLSCEEILYEEDITTSKVMLLAPTNGVSMNSGTITFSWQKVNGATEYQLQAASPNFTNAVQVVLDTIVSGVSFDQQLEVNNYEWRLKALNSAYETAYTTNAFEVVEVSEP